MKVFLTGANGLVGSFVLKELLKLGYKPFVLLRKNCNTQLIDSLLSQIEIIEGDILDEILLEKCFLENDIVIHCAGLVSYNPSRNKEIFMANVQGTTNVVNACISSKVKKLIHVSSIAALGRSELTNKYNEESKWESSDLNSNYSKSKYLAELEVFRGGEEGLDFSIVNPSVVIGPGDIKRSSTRVLEFIRKQKYFYPEGNINIVDVRDVARVICSLISIAHKNRLILNSESISYERLFEISARCRGTKNQTRKIPLIALKAIAFLDSIRRIFVKGEPFITKENLKFINLKLEYNSLFYSNLFPDKLISAKESIAYSISELEQR